MQGKYYLTWVFRLMSLMFVFVFPKGALANTQQVTMPHFALESGDTLAPAVVSYSMFGGFNADSSNVVLVCTWFTGKSTDVGRLWTAETGYIDTSRYAIVVIDALGNGLSASPSNYRSAAFPDITMADMVRMQHEVVTRHLGIRELYAVAGISMGGMQALQWMVMYPHMAGRCISIAGTPRCSSYDLLFWDTNLRLLQQAVSSAPAQRDSLLQVVAMLQQLHLYTPEYRIQRTRAEGYASFLQQEAVFPATAEPRNWQLQIEAMMRHDVYRYLQENTLAELREKKILMIVSDNDLMVNAAGSQALADATGARLISLHTPCGHQASVDCGKAVIRDAVHELLNDGK